MFLCRVLRIYQSLRAAMKLCPVFVVRRVLVKLAEGSVFADGSCANNSMSFSLQLFFFFFNCSVFNMACWYFVGASFLFHVKSAKDGPVPYQLSVFLRALDCIFFLFRVEDSNKKLNNLMQSCLFPTCFSCCTKPSIEVAP